ncbi:glycine C-acetyltransferase [Marinomonas sp. M1K-6]|uniref:2-amino-3-ketobutyrate coenzyme A ligase n=1 Tax=Marinomonas profundi TaxID=2726122 RepID=A0A847R7L4_9GAMM|nr:glycine C-acetyltransferase [Marinomonas profundi]NLQ18066.1 glycine C-acetyltransferase [Marinomonas profundi]UDV04146.1 glycine C-acetyltransferase [Marinomonas profundi]
MSKSAFYNRLQHQLDSLKQEGLYKQERPLITPQASQIRTADNSPLINLCANNYLGLANDKHVTQAAHDALDKYGYGMASVRFICGTQSIHTELEKSLSAFLQMEDTILYSSCFDANGGLFETLLDKDDAVISDALNHASIIDGIRLCKAKRYRYANNDMQALEACLQQADKDGAKTKLIVTDGVFSMDGIIADLASICDLADQYDALVMVDDSHAVGFLGEQGRGSHEYCGVLGRIDIITGTLGKALGGASGGYTSASKSIVDWLRQRSRPYLFSNSLAPVIVATSLSIIESLKTGAAARQQLKANSQYFRTKMSALGFHLVAGDHPIIAVILGDAKLAQEMANRLYKEGIFVTGFAYPVVPMGKARIRTQMSASLTTEQLDHAIAAFAKTGRELGIIKGEGQ